MSARRPKLPPLVSRDEELDRLEEVLDALFAGQRRSRARPAGAPLAAKLGSDRLANPLPDRFRLFTAVAGFLRRLAARAAVGYYQRALELMEAPGAPERTSSLVGELWEKSGDLWVLIGEAGRDVEAYREAIAALQEVPDGLRLAQLHRKAAFAHLSWHDADSAEPHLIAAESLLVDSSDVAEKGRLRRAWAHWLRDRRRLDEALEAAKESLEVAERHGEPSDVVAAHETLAIVFNFSGEASSASHRAPWQSRRQTSR